MNYSVIQSKHLGNVGIYCLMHSTMTVAYILFTFYFLGSSFVHPSLHENLHNSNFQILQGKEARTDIQSHMGREYFLRRSVDLK